MKIIIKILFALFFIVLFNFCSDSTSPDDSNNFDKSLGFFPLQIGNYWETNLANYSRIEDTIRIGDYLYYKEVSLVGGDALGIRMLRVDEANNLILGVENHPTIRAIIAKFDLAIGDTFRTIGDGSNVDDLVTVINKTDNEMSFEYVSPSATFTRKYIKGFGMDRNDRYAIINGKEYYIDK